MRGAGEERGWWRSGHRTRLWAGAGLPVPAALGDSAGMLVGSVTNSNPVLLNFFPRKEPGELGAEEENQARGTGQARSFLIYFCPAGTKQTHNPPLRESC